MTIGQRIKQRREELGMTQDELAKKCGYSGKTIISYIENGKRSVPMNRLKVIADALDTSVEYLIGEDKALIEDISCLSDEQKQIIKTMINSWKAEK